ncbi:DUF305 domain-containing protein [Agromyces sp. ZXT2-6]|uniref:DUF305 domain-containing protein n=1 Tax=Agromyces sp. ZXT2-6 TaxID=3461153 RepID=UPI0040550B31
MSTNRETHATGHGGDGHGSAEHDEKEQSRQTLRMYLRFAAMILTSMVVMYFVMFAGSWEWTHIRFSQSRIFMAVTMGGTMGLVMLAWMLGMYKSTKGNIAVIAASVLLIGGGIALDRTQATVDDTSFMRAMIPHHSLAITRSERFQNEDVRVCELAVEISEAQRREITEMDWLIRDIVENGPATTAAEAESRAVPDFGEPADRTCPSE